MKRSSERTRARAECWALVVDDNPSSRELTRLVLGQLGLSVEVAADGFAGVEAAVRQPFDLVVMDVQMPGLDGCEATRRICAHLARSRVTRPVMVAYTGDASLETRRACLAAGMVAVLEKPAKLSHFEALVQRWVWARSSDGGASVP